jgi:hypothetical protein
LAAIKGSDKLHESIGIGVTRSKAKDKKDEEDEDMLNNSDDSGRKNLGNFRPPLVYPHGIPRTSSPGPSRIWSI